MPRWNIIYYPPPGQNDSPEDFIAKIQPPKDANWLSNQLDTIASMETNEWPPKWVKRIGKIYQLTSRDHRLYFGLDEGTIIVACYICRKRGQKADPKDLKRANNALQEYFETKDI